jgi:gliding motility-associated-like protein
MSSHKVFSFIIYCLSFFSFFSGLYAQAPFYGDCANHVRVCGDTIFPIDATSPGLQEVPPSGSLGNPNGNIPPSTNQGCLLTGETFPTWILVEIQTGGVLEFIFGGGGTQVGFYDWIMYDFTNVTCADIANNLVPPVRCNWNGSMTGGTGIVNFLPPGGDSTNYELPLQVNACDKYMIVFNNFSSVQTLVPMQFFGTAAVCQPILPFSISPLPLTVCAGDSAQLNVGSGAAYEWTPSTGLSNPFIGNPKAAPDSTTTYVVRTFVQCPFFERFDTVTVSVRYGPQAVTFPDTFYCEGSGGVGIGASVTGGVTPYTYVWSPNDGSLSDVNALMPVANPNVRTRYYFYATGFDGCRSNIDSMDVDVVPLPIVNAGPDLEFCADAPGVFLQGQILNPSGNYELQWRPSTGLFCDTCLVTYAQPNSTTAYTLRVRSLTTGCESDSTTLNTQSTALVIVKPRPIAYAGADTVICQLDSAQLYATFTGAGPVYNFAWAPPHGITQPSIVNPKASPAYTTEYYLVVSSNGCESIADTLQVTVRPIPIVTGGNTKNICAGDSVQLDAQVQTGIAQAYRWTPGAGLSDSMVLHPMASPLVTTTYTMRAFNGICPSLPANVLVVVHSIPVANVSLDTTICAGGDSITLSANVLGGNPPYTMQWSPVSGLGNPLSISTQANPVQTTMYYYSVSSGTGATRCGSVDSVLVTVLPEVIAQLEADTSIICPGETIQLQASGGVGNATYQWSPVSGLSSPGAAQTFASPSITTQYTVQVSEGQCRDSAKWTVTVHPDPGAAFHMSQVQGCAPLEVVMGNTSANALSYTWDFGDGSVVSNEINPRHTFTKSGSYQVKLMVRGVGGCADTIISALPVQVSDGLVVDFSSDPVSPAEIAGPEAEIRFTDRSQGANRWLWEFGDGAISTEQNPVYQYPTPGKYVVTLIASDGKGCEQRVSKGPFHIFMPEFIVPNVFTPNGDGMNDVFRVEYTGDEQYRIQIYDRWGVKYFESYNQQQHWDGLDLNGRASAEGIYYYNIQLSGKSYSGSVTLLR